MGHTETPSVSVIVCTYTEDRWDSLVAAVRSLEKQTRLPNQIVVVVDHNEDLFRIACRVFSKATVMENCKEGGLSGARNCGIEAATGDIIAFLDDDSVAERAWLQKLLAPYSDSRVSAVGGSIVPAWEWQRPAWFPEEFDWVVGCTYRGMPVERGQIRNLIGANMSFRRSAIEIAGAFSSRLGRVGDHPAGCEETELCIRLRQRLPGTRILYEPEARVQHSVTEARAEFAYFRRRCLAEGQSKAVISRLVGTADSLSAERAYVVRSLSRAVARNAMEMVRRRDLAPGRTAIAILAGLTITTLGYLTASGRSTVLRVGVVGRTTD